MKIIVPMAGRGKRLRPHTLTVPKPLVPIAGVPVVERLLHDLVSMCSEEIEEIAFVIGDFGKEVEEQLKQVAERLGSKGTIHYQEEALGTAHAILCAEKALEGNVIIAFADMLLKADFELDTSKDGIIWVQRVKDPSAYGVVKVNDEGYITEFVEKPDKFVSDLAIVGVYYFKDGENLRKELQYLIDNNIKEKGEFQLTNAMEHMKQKGKKLYPGEVAEWLDCGNKDAAVDANKRVLEWNRDKNWIAESVHKENAHIIEPCYIGEKVEILNSVVGPYVSIGDNSKIIDSVITNSIIQGNTTIGNKVIADSMIGNNVNFKGKKEIVSIGDFTETD